MGKFKEKVATVEAEQWDGTRKGVDALRSSLGIHHDVLLFGEKNKVDRWFVDKAETMRVNSGDYIGRDGNGNLFVMSETKFLSVYDALGEDRD